MPDFDGKEDVDELFKSLREGKLKDVAFSESDEDGAIRRFVSNNAAKPELAQTQDRADIIGIIEALREVYDATTTHFSDLKQILYQSLGQGDQEDEDFDRVSASGH